MDCLRGLLLDKDTLERVRMVEGLTEQPDEQRQQSTSMVLNILQESGLVPSDTWTLPAASLCSLGKDLCTDIEVFEPYSGGSTDSRASDTLFGEVASGCSTVGGRQFLRSLITAPLANAEALQARSAALRALSSGPAASVAPHMAVMSAHEADFVWLYETHDGTDIGDVLQMAYFRTWFTRWLNGNDVALTANNIYTILLSPTIGVLSPVLYLIIPFLVIRFQLGITLPLSTYLHMSFAAFFGGQGTAGGLLGRSGGTIDKLKYVSAAFSLLFYFQGLFNSFEIARGAYRISALLTNRVNGALEFVRAAMVVAGEAWTPALGMALFAEAPELYPDARLFDELQLKPFSLFSNFGSRLAALKCMRLEHFVPIARRAYAVDAAACIVGLAQSKGYCWATFNQTPTTTLNIEAMRHPCLPAKSAVANDVVLGGKAGPSTMLLTGPNAGGKSTLIKGVLCNVLLAQTLTVAAAKSVCITPFCYIASQIDVPDCKGKESLFEAEMHRSRASLEALAALSGRPTLVAMDEIFSSTNPVEGIAGAYAVVRRLAASATGVAIISTHYLYLARLARECPSVVNYQMPVNLSKDGCIAFPYKLRRGVCRQFIALELLRRDGFDDALVTDALAVKEHIMRHLGQRQ